MSQTGALDIQRIREILPHRYPFLLLDRVLGIDWVIQGKSHVGSTLRALKNVTANEQFFNGHFPDEPIMPGVLIIEAMAQAAAMLGHKPRTDGLQWTFLIMGVDKARWRRKVVPGDQLIFEIKMIKDRGTLFVFECQAKVDGELAAEAEIMAKMVDPQ